MTISLPAVAVTLLAHRRLADFEQSLRRKVALRELQDRDLLHRPPFVRDTDRRILELAARARAAFEGGPHVPVPNRRMLGQSVSGLALTGTAALDLAGYLDLMEPAGNWVETMVRRGNGDPNLSRVTVPAARFALRAGQIALGKTADPNEQAAIRAFTSGLLCTIATNLVGNPVMRDLQAQIGPIDWDPRTPLAFTGPLNGRVGDTLLEGVPRSPDWERWWPSADDVPKAVFEGLAEALREVYGLAGERPSGFADFEDGIDQDAARRLAELAQDPDRLREAYRLFRQGDLAIGRGWGWFAWAAVLMAFFLMAPLTLLIGLALPHGSRLLTSGPAPDEQSVYELLTLGLVVGSLSPFIAAMVMWPAVPTGSGPFVNALVFFILRLALALVWGFSLGSDWKPGVRWGLVATPLMAIDIYFLIRGVIAAGDKQRPGPKLVFLMQILPLITAVTALAFGGLIHLVGGERKEIAFWVIWAILTVAALVASGLMGNSLAKAGGIPVLISGRGRLPLTTSLPGAAGQDARRGFARLFDDSTLWHDPANAAPTLADLAFPAGRRALVRLWWEGSGRLEIRHDRHRITFRREDGTEFDLRLPPTPITASDLAQRIAATVQDADGSTDRLKTEVVDDAAARRYPLPFPEMLSDPGDTAETRAEHDALRDAFVEVGTSRKKAYLLHQAPRVEQTTPFAPRGPSGNILEGFKVVPEASLADLDGSALGIAADLAAMLCMGAVPTMAGGPVPVPGVAANPNLAEVRQVFRQWNLDERRVNEWRMLVVGGAAREDAGAAPAGEPLTRELGWVPLWRAWSRMATDLTTDTDSTAPAEYNPPLARAGGRPVAPANRDLTQAIRYLFELP